MMQNAIKKTNHPAHVKFVTKSTTRIDGLNPCRATVAGGKIDPITASRKNPVNTLTRVQSPG
jgi:hypothetical protein